MTLTNAALIERTAGDFRFYEDGITPAVGRLIQAVDRERLTIAAALGVRILSEPDLGVEQGYMTESNYSTGSSKAPGFLGHQGTRLGWPPATSPRTLATPWCCSPTSPGALTCPRP